MAKIGLSAPWTIFYRELEAFFKNDKDVRVLYDEDAHTVKLFVDNAKKATILTGIIPAKKRFGNVELKILIIPANGALSNDECTIQDAFENNDAVSFIRTVTGILASELIYVVFKKEVVQYFTDDLGDYYGFHSTLYENLARDIFENLHDVYFSTDMNDPNKLGVPLGEWP